MHSGLVNDVFFFKEMVIKYSCIRSMLSDMSMLSDIRIEQNRTEILFGLEHYKLIVTTIHNIQNIYFTHAFKV